MSQELVKRLREMASKLNGTADQLANQATWETVMCNGRMKLRYRKEDRFYFYDIALVDAKDEPNIDALCEHLNKTGFKPAF